jgi:hypothetical protein
VEFYNAFPGSQRDSIYSLEYPITSQGCWIWGWKHFIQLVRFDLELNFLVHYLSKG